jgi:hypothetical protein
MDDNAESEKSSSHDQNNDDDDDLGMMHALPLARL